MLTRRVKQPDGSWRDTETFRRVDLVIDLDTIFRELGTKALGNKSKLSRAMASAIIAQARVM
jgi:hypothetical protein